MNSKLTSLCLIICIVFTQLLLTVSVYAEPSDVRRIWGGDRYMTALAISQAGWEKSDYVIIARGDDFADALCAAPLAKKYNAPLLLNVPDKLNNDVLKEIIRLNVKQVIIIGGYEAISLNIENELKSSGIINIWRIWGQDRYETSVRIAEELGNSSTAAVAAGSDFPDALSISSIASIINMPILLTEKDKLPPKAGEYLKSRTVLKTYIIGGTGVISESVKSLLPNPVRLGGRDRYETNTLVLQEFENSLDFNNICAAVGDGTIGDEYADALTGSVFASRMSSPLIIVNKSLSDVIKDFLTSKLTPNCKVTVFGGESVVSQEIINEILKCIKKPPVQGGGGGGGASASPSAGNVSINSLSDMIISTGEAGYITVISSPGDALISAAADDKDVVDLSVQGSTLTIRGLRQGKATITITASKSGYNSATLVFSVFVEPVKLTWDMQQGEREAGETVTFKLESEVMNGAVLQNDVVYIMNWTKDGVPIREEDIMLSCIEGNISNINDAQGLYTIGSPHLVQKYESYSITAVFNCEGKYDLTAFAAKNIQ